VSDNKNILGAFMKKISKWALVVLMLVILMIIGSIHAVEQDLSTTEKEVWSMEETYWHFVASGDIESYMTLWHEDFVGWPRGSEQPVNKEGLIRQVKAAIEAGKPGSLTFKLTPYSVRIYGDVAIVHYLCSLTWKDLQENEHSRKDRMTHTWMRQDGRWLIIGGMSAI